jgi:hypothetical protein
MISWSPNYETLLFDEQPPNHGKNESFTVDLFV